MLFLLFCAYLDLWVHQARRFAEFLVRLHQFTVAVKLTDTHTDATSTSAESVLQRKISLDELQHLIHEAALQEYDNEGKLSVYGYIHLYGPWDTVYSYKQG